MSIQAKVGWRSFVANNQTGIDTDAQAFITAASITDTTQQNAVNTLVTQLKTYGIWTKLKAVYPFVGGTATSHKFNLKDPRDLDAAYRLVFTGGWTHSATGAKPNGTNAWADTKLTPSAVQTLNSNGMGMYLGTLNTATATDPIHMGVIQTASQRSSLVINKANTNISSGLNGTTVVSSTINALGLISSHKTSSTLTTIYKNSTNVGSGNSGGTLPTVRIAFGNVSAHASVFVLYGSGWTNSEHRLTYISDGLDSTDITNFYTAVQTFQSTLGRNVGAPIVADTDAQAFLNAAEITSQTQASAINTLVTDLKSANIWTKMKAIYPFVGGTATAHKFNLKDPRDLDAVYRLVFFGGWIHSSTGALPNGTTGYANTFLTPSTSLSQNSTHISYYSRSNSSGSNFAIGTGYNTFSSDLQIAPRWTDDNTYYRVNSTNGGGVNTGSDSRGLFVANRISNSETRNYRNSTRYVLSLASNSLNNYSVYISSTNNSGTPWSYNNREVSFSSIGDGLSDTEAANFYTAVQKYQTSLGRQV